MFIWQQYLQLWTWATTGNLLKHTHLSDLILLAATLAVVLLLGSAFCGWICPFGAIQEWLFKLRSRLLRRKLTIPPKLDRILRYGRYGVLAAVLFATYSAGELIFGEYCPWKAAWILGSTELAIGGAIILGPGGGGRPAGGTGLVPVGSRGAGCTGPWPLASSLP